MADEIASLKVVVEAEDRASAVISSVGASINDLGKAGSAIVGQSAALNAAMTSGARSSVVLGSSVTQTKNNLKQLESGLADSQKATKQYSAELRASASVLKQKQEAVKEASATYKANSAQINSNISFAKKQYDATESLVKLKKSEIDTLEKSNAHLNSESQAYRDNQQRISELRESVGLLENRKSGYLKTVYDNEAALSREMDAYSSAQAAVSRAANAHDALKGKVKASREEEAEYKSSISKVREELEKQEREYEKLQKAEGLVQSGAAWKQVGSDIDTITKPIQVASVAVMGLGAVSAASAISFEDNFASVKKTVEGTDEELAQIKQDIIDMTTVGIDGHSAIPQRTAELNELAAAGGQLGIKTKNISEFTETMAMLGSATNLSGETGAQTLARFMNVTNTSQEEIDNLGSSIVDLGNNFATTEAEIADMALNMGATGNVVGISAQDVLAYSTALSSLGVEAAAGGSAVSRIWMEIQSAVSSGGEDLHKFAKLSGKSSEDFKKQWQEDASGAFQDFLKGLNQDKDQITTLTDLGFNNIRDIQALQRLAGEKGFKLLTEAIERSNTAWSENTALQTEFEAKAETTASKIQVAKNNAAEAARSFGEIMLPTIVDVTGGLANMTHGLASMSDGGKKALVTSGAVVIGLGAVSKAAAGTVKTVGGVIEGVGSMKKALAAGGALAKFAPMISSIATAAGPAALAVAGITAAVIAGKTAYDTWYNSNYKFADKLYENAEQLKSYQSRLKELNDLQWEYNDLTDKITSKNISDEELKYAQTRLNEIKTILQDKYKIDIDSGDIDKAVEKAEKLEELNFYNQKKELRDDVENLAPNYERAIEKLPKLEAEYARADKAVQLYGDTLINVAEWQEQYDKGIIDSDTYTKQFTDALNKLGKECGKGEKYGEQLLNLFSGEIIGGLENPEFLSSWLQNQLSNVENELNIEGIEKKIKDAEETIRKYKESVQELAAIELSELKDDFADGVIDNSTAGAEIDSIIEKVSKLDSGLQKLYENEKIDVKFNMDTGGLDIFDLDGNKLGEITANGKINWESGELPEIKDQDGKIIYYGDYSNLKAPTLQGTIEYTPVLGNGGSNFNKFGNTGKFGLAKGSQNFPGGLAMVNDERGISDNRELIVDRGRAFIPEGRDVILPLSKGAKVYTAAQTKAIMSGLGIPHYASGKNNSDMFTAAKDDWTHYTKTHSVTTAQELEKWLEFQEKYKQNEKDIWDIEEQVFSLQQKLYSERVKESENWLRHEEKYNGMAASDYLAGIDRMKAYTKEYYEQGIINHKEYTEAMADLDEKYIDKRKEQLEELYNLSTDYISEHTYFNDWQDYGDDPLEAYNRVMDRNREALANGELTQKEFDAYGQKLGSSMYSERKEQSLNWLEEQRKYFGMTDEEYVQGLERIKAYTQEYYDQGLISRREYNEAMTELNHSAWDEASDAYDDMLKEQQDYINKMQEEFQKQEQALRDSWTVEDRKVDMATVQGQLGIYAGAVTDRGQQKYKELEEQMKQLQRDEELYQLQVKNTATIDALQADYETAESMKADFLKNIVTNTDINVSGIVGELTSKVASTGSDINRTLSEIIDAIHGIKMEQQNFNDSRQINITTSDSSVISKYMGGV